MAYLRKQLCNGGHNNDNAATNINCIDVNFKDNNRMSTKTKVRGEIFVIRKSKGRTTMASTVSKRISRLNYQSELDSHTHTSNSTMKIMNFPNQCKTKTNKWKHLCNGGTISYTSWPLTKRLYILLLIAMATFHVSFAQQVRMSQAAVGITTTPRYSQPIKMDDEENFRPIMPKDPEYVARYLFTNEGQYRVFQPVETDLRIAVGMQRHSSSYSPPALHEHKNIVPSNAATTAMPHSMTLKKVTAAVPLTKTTTTTETPLLDATINKLAWNLASEQHLKQANLVQVASSLLADSDDKDEATVADVNDDADGEESSEEEEEDEGLGTAIPVDDSTYDDTDDDSDNTHYNKNLNNDIDFSEKIMARENDKSDLNDNAAAEMQKNTKVGKQEQQNSNTKKINKDLYASNGTAVEEDTFKVELNKELRGLEELLLEYVDNFFSKGQYEPMPGLVIELQNNASKIHNSDALSSNQPTENFEDGRTELTNRIKRHVLEVVDNGNMNVDIPRALQSGRLLFVTGLKKFLWPIWMGLNVLKSVLLAMFLPTIIGSFGKLLGKGITSGSAPLFIRPADTPQELDFRENNFSFDDDTKFMMADDIGKDPNGGYAYQAEASQQQNQYAYNANAINQQALSRYGNNEKQQNLMQDSYLSALQSISSASFKNSQSLSSSSSAGLAGSGAGAGAGAGIGLTAPNMRNKPIAAANVNTFQTFQKVPASSLLLSNYDPFYSPLLSRLDSVFAQLKLESANEVCREKLICLMYANPAKYAPYSNLVSAQLSRELNELRKPTSDNPDILRFFKYMRAAKDGQDGVDCEQSFDKCKEFKDFDNPAMLSTYNDINKLVQARKLT